MRTVKLLNNVSAGAQHISAAVNLDQRTWWKLRIDASGLNGTPRLYVEEAYTGGKVIPHDNDWTVICNPFISDCFFNIDDTEITIEKTDIKGNWFRVRMEANDNTTGTVSILLAYKTFI